MATLKCIFQPAQCDNGLSVIFVHGLGGDAHKTWMNDEKKESSFWPLWLGEDCQCHVWTLDYDASFSAWEDGAMPLPRQGDAVLDCLYTEPHLANRRLLLVGHSLGGLVIKTLIINGRTKGVARYSELIKRICAVVFIACPHKGSHLANLAGALSLVLRINPQVGDLCLHEAHLQSLHQQFLAYQQESQIPIRSYAEEKGVLIAKKYLGMFKIRQRVVDSDSAEAHVPGEIATPLPEDHFSICKPKDREQQIYKSLLQFISEVIKVLPAPSEPEEKTVLKLAKRKNDDFRKSGYMDNVATYRGNDEDFYTEKSLWPASLPSQPECNSEPDTDQFRDLLSRQFGAAPDLNSERQQRLQEMVRKLYVQYDLETRVEEKLRIKAIIDTKERDLDALRPKMQSKPVVADSESLENEISRHASGLEKPDVYPWSDTVLLEEKIRLDVSHPEQVIVNTVFDLAVTVNQPNSPLPEIDDLPKVKSASGKIYRPSEEEVIRYRIEVTGEYCTVKPDHCIILLRRGENAQPRYFQVICSKAGNRTLLVNAYQEDDVLAAQTRTKIDVDISVQPANDEPAKAGTVTSLDNPIHNEDSVGRRMLISYSHDSDTHRDFVRLLADRFRKDGLDCWIDQYVLGHPHKAGSGGWSSRSNRLILSC